MGETQAWVALAGAFLLFLGTVITVMATRGKTKTDAKTAFDERVDERMNQYTDRLESRLGRLEGENGELRDRVDHLEDQQRASTVREKVLYRYTAALRNHVLQKMPPPPPPIPDELIEWYENFESVTGLS